jgi:hypothetical protein
LQRDILFSVFTKERGAFPVYHTKDVLTESDALKIAVKSQMTLSMMQQRAELESAEAILPFTSLEENLIGFIYLFQILQNNPMEPNCVAALTYLIPQENQAFLYSKIPFLKFTAEDFASKIKQQYIHGQTKDFPKPLQDYMKNWDVSEKESQTEIVIIEKKVTLSERTDGGSIDFFFTQVKKHEDRALGALYRGNPLIVTGESSVMIDMVVHSLDLFIPQMIFRKVSFSTELIDPKMADIIGIDKNLIKRYPNETIVDTKKKQVRNGKSCNFSKQVIKLIKKDPSRSENILREAYEQVLNVANLLIDIFSYSEEERGKLIEKVQGEHDPSLIEVAVDFAAKSNPLIKELLMQEVSNRFVDWIDGF